MKTVLGQKYKLDKTSKIYQALSRIFNHVKFIPSQRCYNLTISNKKKFVWFRVAKVGTRTIYDHLKASGIFLNLDHPYNISYAPGLYKDYFKFAFVRNPWERLVSSWNNKVIMENHFKFNNDELKRMRKFKNFIEYVSGLDIENCDNHLRLQCALIDLNEIDYLGRFEYFKDDLPYVLERIGIKTAKLLHRNKSLVRKSYREYFDNKLRDKTYHIYQKDIDIFGYKFD